MKEIVLTRCERNFINKAIEEDTRIDGRKLLEGRPLDICFGESWGSCVVSLGKTKVLAQVSCDIQPPKASRPNEGKLYFNVELNPLAAPHFEAARMSEAGVLINRHLEQCFIESKCLDLESLCIVSEKQVWNIRVDINILSHDGNILGCASIASLAALSHFHRPDVTSTGEEIVIHSFAEKDPLPMTINHSPIIACFIAYECGKTILDPTYVEERVGIAQLMMGVNSYRELCSLHYEYMSQSTKIDDMISAMSNYAADYARDVVQKMKDTVKTDVQARYEKLNSRTLSLKSCIPNEKGGASVET